MEKNIEKKQEGLKRAFEKNIAAKVEAVEKHTSGIHEQHEAIKSAQAVIVRHNLAIQALEKEKEELLKEFEEFKQTLD